MEAPRGGRRKWIGLAVEQVAASSEEAVEAAGT